MAEIILAETASVGSPSASTVSLYADTTANPQFKFVDDGPTTVTILDSRNTVVVTGKTFGAGTTSVAPIYFTSGVNLSTAAAGAMEFDGTVFYVTAVASARMLSVGTMFSIVPAADFNLLTTSGVQSAFPTTGDVWTLAAATTYLFEGQYLITHTTTTCTVAMAFACSNAPTSIAYHVWAMVGAVNTTVSTATATTANLTYVNQVSTTVVTATSTANFFIRFRGILRTNLATTVTPQVNWSANTTAPVMLHDSYITFTPTGTSTANILGNVG